MTLISDSSCPVGQNCPEIAKVEGGFELVGEIRPDPTLPEYEARIFQPDRMHPQLADLVIEDMTAWLAARRNKPGTMLRVQTRDAYSVQSDDDDFAAYANGRPGPNNRYLQPFIEQLESERAAGMVWQNLLVFNGGPTLYQRYANEWVYTATADDERRQVVRVLDISEHPAAAVLMRTGDFWVVESQHVALVRYDDQNRHEGEVEVPGGSATGYIAAAEMAWGLGTPFQEWWAANPQYRRTAHAA